MKAFGDLLYKKVDDAKGSLFLQGEIAQLTYQAFQGYIQIINESPDEKIEITYPVGYFPDNKPMNAIRLYSKEILIKRYEYLGLSQLPINGLYQLVTTIEALLGDILRMVLIQFPSKIPNKRKVDCDLILEAKSLEEVKLSIINSMINELAYKSPNDFAEEFNKYVGVNLLEKPAFHRYKELKATRDIYIHNQGIANEIYISKSDSLARVSNGRLLPVDIQYFLQSYECCLQVTEILEQKLNMIWPSVDFQKAKNIPIEEQKNTMIKETIKTAKKQPVKKISKNGFKAN